MMKKILALDIYLGNKWMKNRVTGKWEYDDEIIE